MTIKVGGYYACQKCGERYHSSRIHSCRVGKPMKPEPKTVIEKARAYVEKNFGTAGCGNEVLADYLADFAAAEVERLTTVSPDLLESAKNLIRLKLLDGPMPELGVGVIDELARWMAEFAGGEVRRLRTALEHYADEENFDSTNTDDVGRLDLYAGGKDATAVARATLEATDEK